jgi:hypothetical protein
MRNHAGARACNRNGRLRVESETSYAVTVARVIAATRAIEPRQPPGRRSLPPPDSTDRRARQIRRRECPRTAHPGVCAVTRGDPPARGIRGIDTPGRRRHDRYLKNLVGERAEPGPDRTIESLGA